MKDKTYKIYDGKSVVATGKANKWQIKDWRKRGLNVLETSPYWETK